jgi:cellulose synthase/poly-beta-1,6-N-acetylglucosamine synthase-like glycosyltransferase
VALAAGETRLRDSRGAPWTFPAFAGGFFVGVAVLGLDELLTICATALQLLFFVYFARHLAFAMAAMRSAARDLDAPVLQTGYLPPVSVLVACKNEENVVGGLAKSLLELDYPPDRLEVIVVNDGSTDGTAARLDAEKARRPRLRVLHRASGLGGGKSGALNDGLALASGEIVIVFDADHQPHKDVIRRLVRHFDDPTVSAVQGRCVINNPEDSPLTRLVAIDYLAGYLVNEYGRQCLFELPAYGGANCAVRASSLRAAGGWNVRTVTEDTDLTLRLILAGKRVRYDVTAVDEEEGVVTLQRYWRQRYRWARGHQQVWRDYRRAVWASPRLSLADKIETSMFLFGFHLPVASAFGLAILGLWAAGLAHPSDPLNTFVLWTLLFLGPLLELGAGLLVARADRREAIALALFLPIFFVSVALCTKAWLDGLAGRDYTWVKTKRSADVPSVVH